ncbi:T9SS type A sorting domain-containing protein [bacterium]|nr:T9SS type A sorting domain-containing protein [bacterium]
MSDYFDVIDNGDGTITVSAAILGATSGLTTAADLFTVAVHGAQTGAGTLAISDYKLRDLDNADFFATVAGADVLVDCTPPDVPGLFPEPTYTQGTSNTLAWSDMAASGAIEYLIQRAEDAGFTLGLADSGWIAGLSHLFGGLADGQIYHYRVKARDVLLNESAWSAAEFSTQDDTAPVTAVDPLATYQGAASWNLSYAASDATSGVATVELFYQFAGGAWQSLGAVGASPVSFMALDGDGLYGFYTVGTDGAGNVELAPAAADAETTLDTMPPAGTFVINANAAYTNTLAVSLDSGISDLHPPLEMRFSNDGVGFSAWEAYAAARAWTLAAGADGPRTVWAEFKDAVGNVYAVQDAIVYDATAPAGISGLALETGHHKITVTWNDPSTADLAGLEIYRGVYRDAAYVSAYPEYDDLPGATMPARPANRAAAYASPEWELAGTALPGDEIFVDAGAPRGVYVYQVFTVDVALNYGPGQAGPPYLPTHGKANYWLGDVDDYGTGDGFYDGFVNIGDITVMAATFGLCDGAGGYNNEVDVGPTSNNSPQGIPTTDSCIDFEDLIIIAINYGEVAPLATPPAGAGDPVFTWYRIDENTWGFGLLEPGVGLQGLRLCATLPEGMAPQVTAGQGLLAAGRHFLANIEAGGLDANLALLGTPHAFTAAGELLRVTLPAGVAPTDLAITARSTDNAALHFTLDDTAIPELPTVYRVAQNFPNPFNPKTAIRFDLPEAQVARVAVYGADGRLVKQLLDRTLPAGFHQVVWDGTDSAGAQVASGVYFYSVQAGPLSETRKMLLMK